MSGYTAGPWSATALNFGEYEIRAGGKDIALINASDGMDEPTPFPAESNARLIASAPDLLAALQLWVAYDSCDESDFAEAGPMLMYADALEATRAAISKATGTP